MVRTIKFVATLAMTAGALGVRASESRDVTVDVPLDAMLPGDTDSVDCAKLTTPGVTVMVGAVEVTANVLIEVVIVLLPTRMPVKIAV